MSGSCMERHDAGTQDLCRFHDAFPAADPARHPQSSFAVYSWEFE